ncbi:hypothetical protein ACTG0T_12195 [Halococcus morrhuae DSM 1307]|uniref:hypothetical protein n=1 Tax=Halococcus morrhuae TaxID=2250 RepID=UPI001267803B|nr:hypothetical protein [Halococcus morrhuae]
MKSDQTPTGFGLYDLLTKVIPGAFLFIFATFNSGDVLDISIAIDPTIILIIFSTISIIIGIAIQLSREQFRLIPRDIRYICYELSDNNDFLGKGDTIRRYLPLVPNEGVRIITNNKYSFYSILNGYGLNNDPDNLRELYLMLLSDIESDLSSRAYRDKMTMEFCANMVFSSIGALIFATIGAMNGTAPDYSLFISVIFAIPSLFLFTPFTFSLERRWASALIRESMLATDTPVEYGTDSDIRPCDE